MDRNGQISIPLGKERKKELDKFCVDHEVKQKQAVITAIDTMIQKAKGAKEKN